MLFMASGGVNIYHHFCIHGHDDGVVSLVVTECHDVDESLNCCEHDDCDDCDVLQSYDEDDGCCTTNHEFVNVINDFIVEQEYNVPAPILTDADFLLPVLLSVLNFENTSLLRGSDPPDIHVFETGRDLVCLIQNFRIGDCHIA
jgi:hypothetical protein